MKQCAAKGFFELSCLPTTYVRLTITFEQKKTKSAMFSHGAGTKLRATYIYSHTLELLVL